MRRDPLLLLLTWLHRTGATSALRAMGTNTPCTIGCTVANQLVAHRAMFALDCLAVHSYTIDHEEAQMQVVRKPHTRSADIRRPVSGSRTEVVLQYLPR